MKCNPKSISGSKGGGVHNDDNLDINRDGRKDRIKEGLIVSKEGGFHPEFILQPFLKLASGKFYELTLAPNELQPGSKDNTPTSRKVFAYTEPSVEMRFFEGELLGGKQGLMSYGIGQRGGVFEENSSKTLKSSMSISGLAVEFDREVMLPGVARFCATVDDLWNIKHTAYEQVGDKVTQVSDARELSWMVGGGVSKLPVERLNLNLALNPRMTGKYITASEALLRPLLQQLGQEAQEAKDGTRPCLSEGTQLKHIDEVLNQWYATAKAKDPVRADLIWNDPHLHEGLLRAGMIILGINQ